MPDEKLFCATDDHDRFELSHKVPVQKGPGYLEFRIHTTGSLF